MTQTKGSRNSSGRSRLLGTGLQAPNVIMPLSSRSTLMLVLLVLVSFTHKVASAPPQSSFNKTTLVGGGAISPSSPPQPLLPLNCTSHLLKALDTATGPAKNAIAKAPPLKGECAFIYAHAYMYICNVFAIQVWKGANNCRPAYFDFFIWAML